MNFIVGLCEQMKLPKVFNLDLEKSLGRKKDIPYGIMAEMMIVNICDCHKPLYMINEYYKEIGAESLYCILTLHDYIGTICYRLMTKVTRRGTPPRV